MTRVDLMCDRCKIPIHGYRDEGVTVGFYDVSVGYWSKFALKIHEVNVCDQCMWNSAEYKRVYGVVSDNDGNSEP